MRWTVGPFRTDPAALSRLGRAVAQGRQCRFAAGQLWFAETWPAMPRWRTADPCPPRTGGRYRGLPAMADAVALGGARPHQPARLGEWRQRAVVGGASAIILTRQGAGLPLGDCVLSGLPHLVGAWM